jgi:iron complex outermembrane receptor protein
MDNTGDFVNWGVFVDGTYQLTDTIRLAAGLRYSYDEKEYSWQTFESTLDWPFDPARVAYDPSQTGAPEDQWYDKFTRKDDWNKTTGRFVVDWQFTNNAMTYFSYATGYKSGGFDGQSFNSGFAQGAFDPEEMTSVELGLKGDFFDQKLRAEVTLFHHELDGRQESVDKRDGPDDPTTAPGVINKDEEADGIEVIVTWSVTDTLRLAGLTTYRETESVSELYYNADGELAGGDSTQEDTETAYTLKLDWTPEVPYGYLLLHMNYVFTGDPGPDEDTAIFATGPWYFQDKKLLNARLAWTNPDENIEVALWGDNLLDEEYAGNPGGFVAGDDALGAYHTTPEDTLTWGVDLRYSF